MRIASAPTFAFAFVFITDCLGVTKSNVETDVAFNKENGLYGPFK
jgi:hypothetical protein